MSQSSTPPPAAIRTVPIGATMRAAYGAVFGSLGLLAKAAALPFLLSIAVTVLSFLAGQNAALSALATVLSFVPYTLFGVAWHRLTLLGPARGAPVAFPAWTRRHWRFFGCTLAIVGITYLLAIVLVLPATALVAPAFQGQELPAWQIGLVLCLGFAVVFAIPFFVLRLSFAFPAIAVDEAYSLRNSWIHTRGQVLSLFVLLAVTALPIVILMQIVNSWLLASLMSEIASLQADADTGYEMLLNTIRDHAGSFALLYTVQVVFGYILVALMVSAISISFRICTGWVPAPAGGPPARTGNGDGP